MKLIALFVSLSLTVPGLAQSSDEAAVKKTINALFEGMRKGDSSQVKNTFLEGASLQTVAKNKEGIVSVRQEDVAKFAASVASYPAFTLDERLSGMSINVDADLATAWTPYVFYRSNQKSHCGVNAFTLVKVNGEWKIQHVIDTRRKDNCPDK